jgi:hypothetical protein
MEGYLCPSNTSAVFKTAWFWSIRLKNRLGAWSVRNWNFDSAIGSVRCWGARRSRGSEFLDQFVAGHITAGDVDAVMRKLKKAVMVRALGAEMSHHRGYAPGEVKPEDTSNPRNGNSGKTVPSDGVPLRSEMPATVKARLNPGWSASTSGASPVATIVAISRSDERHRGKVQGRLAHKKTDTPKKLMLPRRL